jgi:thiamine transport system permease protein
VVRTVAPRLRAIDVGLREAAAVLGAAPARVRREIILPLVARAVAAAAALAFAVSLGEFGAALFLARADWPTLPVAIFRFLSRPGAENVGQAMALSVVLMALTVVVALAVGRAVPRGWSR